MTIIEVSQQYEALRSSNKQCPWELVDGMRVLVHSQLEALESQAKEIDRLRSVIASHNEVSLGGGY